MPDKDIDKIPITVQKWRPPRPPLPNIDLAKDGWEPLYAWAEQHALAAVEAYKASLKPSPSYTAAGFITPHGDPVPIGPLYRLDGGNDE